MLLTTSRRVVAVLWRLWKLDLYNGNMFWFHNSACALYSGFSISIVGSYRFQVFKVNCVSFLGNKSYKSHLSERRFINDRGYNFQRTRKGQKKHVHNNEINTLSFVLYCRYVLLVIPYLLFTKEVCTKRVLFFKSCHVIQLFLTLAFNFWSKKSRYFAYKTSTCTMFKRFKLYLYCETHNVAYSVGAPRFLCLGDSDLCLSNKSSSMLFKCITISSILSSLISLNPL